MLVRGGWREEGGIGSLLRACWETVVVAGVSLGLFHQAARAEQAKRLGFSSAKEMRKYKRHKKKRDDHTNSPTASGAFHLAQSLLERVHQTKANDEAAPRRGRGACG